MAECQGVGTLNVTIEDFPETPADLDLQLILAPDDAQLLFRRAFALESAGQIDDAKAAYHALLRRHPDHPQALNNLGRLLHAQGARRSARRIFERLVASHPDHTSAQANLGTVLLEADELVQARACFERALELDGDDRLAHLGLARLYAIEGDDAAALAHQRRALAAATTGASPKMRRRHTPQLLLLASEAQLGAVAAERLSETAFAMTTLVVERVAPDAPLPEHHALFNTITDADRNAPALELAEQIAARSDRPVVNPPRAVRQTSRELLPRHLAGIVDALVPRVIRAAREEIAACARDLGWPLLLRAPGYHSGQHFVKVNEPGGLAAALAELPGAVLLAIEYVDTRSRDGKFRKYRAMFVDGVTYPAHLAVSEGWKVHFFSADMSAKPERRAEDAAYLCDPEAALGARAVRALSTIAERLQLDYAGIDFALDASGRVVVFEANATMTVPPVPEGPIWDYRRAPIKRILDATRKMLRNRARAGGWL